jgi:NAD(P)-dependent dehydrogenase (short-subunit alcohol dehydrogenase family)
MPHCAAKQVFAKHLKQQQEEAFRMKKYTREMVRRRKRRMDYRLRDRAWKPQEEPMLSASNIQYEMGDRQQGTAVGGIGVMHLVARRTGLIDAIDAKVDVLKRHLPYHESDHVLNIAYNALSGGTCLEDLAAFEPDPTFPTSGVFRAGLAAFTKLFADKYAADNIRMNNVLPGFIDSLPEKPEFRARIPMGRYGKTEEIAAVVAFLASDGAGYITGQNLRVDGGITRAV